MQGVKRFVVFASLVAALASCAGGARRVRWDELVLDPGEARDPAVSAADLAADEAKLEHEARLEPILRLAVARYPGLVERRERLRAEAARIPAAGRLPDAELKYEQWGVPVARPYALGDAETIMIGVRQELPPRGSRGARAREAEAAARAAAAELRVAELDLIQQVKRAWYEYYLADREHRVHVQHMELTMNVLELAKATYQSGKGTQQGVLAVIVEASRLHNDINMLAQRRQSAAALLNTLMARPPGAKLGPIPDLPAPDDALDLDELRRQAVAHRPELAAVRQRVLGREAALAAERSEARWPTFMIGADYMFMPTMESRHGYGVMVSMSLPWLNPANDDEVEAAVLDLRAERSSTASVENAILFEVEDAWLRLQSARRSATLIERDLLPQAQRSVEAAQATFASGAGNAIDLLDAVRSLLLIRLEEARAQVDVEASLADLERATGAKVRSAGKGERP